VPIETNLVENTMTTDWQHFHEPQSDPFGEVPSGLGPPRSTFRTAGQLAALMARLPADTPVLIAETVRVAEHLDPGSQPHRAITVAEIVPISNPDTIIEDAGRRLREHGALRPAVQLGTIIIAEDSPGLPLMTVPATAHECAVEAMVLAETTAALDAHIDQLRWIADTLVTDADDEAGGERDDAAATVAQWIDDPDLRAALAIEADRLRHTAARLTALCTRIADYEAVTAITDTAEEIVQLAAEYPDPDDKRPT
jgi:hypothetical protein